MSRLDTIMTQAGLPALRRVVGDEAVYAPPDGATPLNTWAILRKGSALVGQYGERLETRLTAQLPVDELPVPEIGAELTIGTTTYRIEQVDDQTLYFTTVALRIVE